MKSEGKIPRRSAAEYVSKACFGVSYPLILFFLSVGNPKTALKGGYLVGEGELFYKSLV